MDLKGARVVLGWVVAEDPDGGSGHLGTVVSMDKNTVGILFDDGKARTYPPSTSDIFVYDLGPTGFDHPNVQCAGCSMKPLIGIRWQCSICQNYDLCTQCYHGGIHELGHAFSRISLLDCKPVLVSPRRTCDQNNQVRGFFRGAQVMRGKDWEWGSQDGGSGRVGRILDLFDWKLNKRAYPRSGVRVKWSESHLSEVYRTGFKGKVDLVCIEPTVGGRYFKEHLPTLGSLSGESRLPREWADRKFQVGDLVTPNVLRDEMVLLQQGHGGYNDAMAKLVGIVGKVVNVLNSGDVTVDFSSTLNNKKPVGNPILRAILRRDNDRNLWAFNPKCLMKVEHLELNSKVKVISNKLLFRAVQENNDAWADRSDSVCGCEATVHEPFDGRLVTVIADNGLVMKLSVAAIETAESLAAAVFEDLLVRFLGSLQSASESQPGVELDGALTVPMQSDVGGRLMRLIVDGQTSQFQELLGNNTHLVNTMVLGKSLLQVAALQGNTDIVKCLLQQGADVNLPDEDRDTALHFAANQDKDVIGRMLIRRGALIDAQNKHGLTALHLAVYRQCDAFVRMLVFNDSNVNVMDEDGDTPIHVACLTGNSIIGCCLLDSSTADVTVVNKKGFNALHLATLKGQNEIVSKMVRKFPGVINISKEDGYTALHIAVVNGLEDIVCLLLNTNLCDLEKKTKNGRTPLMLACVEGFLSLVKLLINFGACIDAEGQAGETSLHICILKHMLMTDLPDELIDMEMYPSVEAVKGQFTKPVASGIVIACFLIDKGASVDYLNNEGRSAFDICEDQNLKNLLSEFAKKPVASRGAAAPVQSDDASPNQRLHQVPTAEDKCRFCDRAVQGRFQPCGHAILCERHAKFMKTCPQCETAVEGVTGIQQAPKCIICRDSAACVTFRPCGHCIACSQCGQRFRICLTCDSPVASKEDLGSSGPANVVAGAQDSSMEENEQNLCVICYERRRNAVFLCGHGACKTCAYALQVCHICRDPVERVIVMYD